MKRILVFPLLLMLAHAPRLLAADFAVSAESKIHVDVKATGDNFVATLEKLEGLVTFTDDPRPVPARANFQFDFKELNTHNKKRDAEMLKWLEYEKFPQGKFKLTQWNKVSDSQGVAIGEFSLHGVTRAVQVPLTLRVETGKVYARGEFSINTTDFKLPIIRKYAFLTVQPVVKIRLDLVGERSHAQK